MKRFLSILISVTMLCGVVATANTNTEESTMVISDLMVETIHEPLGISPVLAPRFSWKLESLERGQGQTAYAITVGSAENGDDMWSTGWVESTAQHAEYAGADMADRTKYYVTLKVKDINGAVCESATTFETGIREENWEAAKWIGWGNTKRLRKVVNISSPVKQARVYIAGLGYYELTIEGEKVGQSVLESPVGKDRVRYATFDVTDMLKQGNDCFGIILGTAYEHGTQRRARMIMTVDYENGTSETVVTDESWSASDKSEIVSDSIYTGEVYDARLEDGWKMADYTETSDWHTASTQNIPYLYKDGKLYLNSYGELLYEGGMDLTDYTVEGDITTSSSMGFIFRGVDANNFCMWQVRNGMIRPHLRQEGKWSSRDIAFTQEGSVHRVKLEIVGDTVKTYVNGNLIDTTTVPFAKGTVGFRAVNGEIATVENYKVTDAEGNVLYTTEDTATWAEYVENPPMMDAQLQDMRVMKSHAPVAVYDRGNGVYIVDAGDNATGWLALKNINGSAGDTIKMRYAELIHEDGSLDARSMYHKTINSYTLSGKGNENYTPRFFFTTFRYVEITGFPGVPTIDNFEIQRVYSNMETIGEFSSSNKLLDDILDAYLRTQTSVMMSAPIGSAKREKHGWLGDAHVTAEACFYLLDAVNFHDKWMYDISDQMERAGNTGFMNLQAPDYKDLTGPNSGYKDGDICWTIAVFLVPWETYIATGDTTYLSRHYDRMKSHMDWWLAKGKGNSMHWDWVGIDKPKTSAQMFADAYYCKCLEYMYNIADVLGKEADESYYKAKYEEERSKFHNTWYRDGYYDKGTQGSNATAIAFNLVPEEYVQEVMESIEKNVYVQNGGHLTTGCMGTKNLMDALTAYNRPDIAYTINTKKTFPSLGFMIESGATSLWEYWQHINCQDEPEKYPGQFMPTYGPELMSHGHCFLGGGFATWLFKGIAGINPETAGFETVRIAPQIPYDLKEASAKIDTVRGVVSSEWSRDENNNLTLKVKIPTGSNGIVAVPYTGSINDVTVTEGENVIYSGNSNSDTEFIRWVENTDMAVVFEVASGEYVFNMSGEGKYPHEAEKNYLLKYNAFENISQVLDVTDHTVDVKINPVPYSYFDTDYVVVFDIYDESGMRSEKLINDEDITDDTVVTLDLPTNGEDFELRTIVYNNTDEMIPFSNENIKKIKRKSINYFKVAGVEADIDDLNCTLSVTIPSISAPLATYALYKQDAVLDIEQNETVSDGQQIVYTCGDETRTYTLRLDIVDMTVIELPEGSMLKETADIENSTFNKNWTVNNAEITPDAFGTEGYSYTTEVAGESVGYNFENKLGANSVATLKFYSPIIGHNTRYGFKYVDNSGEHTVQIGGNVAKAIPSGNAYNLHFDNNVNRYNESGTEVTQSVGWHEFAVIADKNGELTFYIDGVRVVANGKEFSKNLGENGYISGIYVDVPGWFAAADGVEYLQGAITDIRLFDLPDEKIKTFKIGGTPADIDEANGTISATVYDCIYPVISYTLTSGEATLSVAEGSVAEDGLTVTYTNGEETKTYILKITTKPLPGVEIPANVVPVEIADIQNSSSDSKWVVKGATLEVNPYGFNGQGYTLSSTTDTITYNFENKIGANSIATLKFYSPIIGHNTRYTLKYVDDSGEHRVQIAGNVAKTIPSNKAYTLFFDHNVNRYYSTGACVAQSVGWHEFAVVADENGTLTFYIDGERVKANGAEFSKSLGENGYISGISVDVPGWFTVEENAKYLQGAVTDIRLYDTSKRMLRGDADGDGKVTVYDAVNVLKITAGVVNNTVTKAADVDGDGKIGVSDATAILRYIARITDKLQDKFFCI